LRKQLRVKAERSNSANEKTEIALRTKAVDNGGETGKIEATSCKEEESRPSAREDAGSGDWSVLVWLVLKPHFGIGAVALFPYHVTHFVYHRTFGQIVNMHLAPGT
jgi:hypothetical protein